MWGKSRLILRTAGHKRVGEPEDANPVLHMAQVAGAARTQRPPLVIRPLRLQ